VQSLYEEHQEMLSGDLNFKNLRQTTQNADAPSIPVFAIIMKDLIYLDEVFNEQQNGEINFYKYRKISEMILNVTSYQMVPYPEVNNPPLEQYLELTMKAAKGISDKGLYTLSKQWE